MDDSAPRRRDDASTSRTQLESLDELTPVTPELPPRRAPRPRPAWEVRYARSVAAADVLAIVVSLGLREVWGDAPPISGLTWVLAGVTLGLTVMCLIVCRTWESAVLGQGAEEFSRLLRAMVTSAVVLGLIALALKLPEVRPWVFGVLPIALLLAALGRLLLRKALYRRRKAGACLHEVLAVGTEEAVAQLISRTRRAGHHGWTITAVCTPSGTGTDMVDEILGVPVIGDLDAVAPVAREGSHRVVSVAPAPGWTPRRLHQLAWDLEGTGTELVVEPGLMEVAGPRLHVAAVDGLPLLRLTEPNWSGVPRVVKAVSDRVLAALLLVLVLPVMVGLAVAVGLDGGPIFFRQARVGRHGRRFQMIKFRSMVVDAERRRPELANEAAGPLFKVRNDPRITRVGRWMRKYSLDELPQLFNVIAGSMALVGPRPPLPKEVEGYSRDARRKLMVKPGLTGLWQVSGRSDLSWEESVRLDLRYVENWTLALDWLILWKTIGAVVRGTGAY
ncbi:sugar transferase [Pseudonocardia nigra]|uniref:sugar transferase n=1 Tax=Pseudonocardia nigra TaxID=1921578 RepID=UPI0027E38454|nr:sugar transferase [Pseudonocardia nigra]